MDCDEVLKNVQERLQDVMECIKDLPPEYQYKVREMLSCAETVVSMYCDVQNGTVPELPAKEVPQKTTLKIGDIDLGF